jgi:epoxyqueuosine reductase
VKQALLYLQEELSMIDLFKKEALLHGDKLQILSIKCLQNLKTELEFFEKREDLNSFQKWIVNDMYVLEVPTSEFTIKSIVIIAIPHPAYAKVEFIRQGKKYNFVSLIMSDFNKTEKYLNEFLAQHNYHLAAAPNLPLKRLAVQSGLAVYGRNNISYVEGMGSFFSYAAYFTDIPCDNNDWSKVRQADICTNCNICINNCPTEAISEDRFLINNKRCLSYLNESADEFPEWLPLSVHHCLYDCLKC